MRVLISCTSPDVVVRTSRVPICDHSRHVIRYVILSTVSRVFSRRPRRRPCGTDTSSHRYLVPCRATAMPGLVECPRRPRMRTRIGAPGRVRR